MHVTLVHVYVKKGDLNAFISATQQNHEASIHEAGNLRFDVLQDPADTSHFLLYEAYQSEAAALDHKKTAHYLKWRDAVAEMMDKPREGVPMQGLFPR
jgi:(4S)-4-hydroxy-5-phosphonooxypentane-2,3-dione isomerase